MIQTYHSSLYTKDKYTKLKGASLGQYTSLQLLHELLASWPHGVKTLIWMTDAHLRTFR